jgi:hypothetical protein
VRLVEDSRDDDGPAVSADGIRAGRVTGFFVAQLALTLALVAASYLVPPWSPAYAGARSWVQVRFSAVGAPPAWPGITVPLIVLLMALNQELAVRAVGRGVKPRSHRGVIGGALFLGAISVFIFPGGSNDLELYHAHARMLAREHASPYRTTPAQALGADLPATMPWADQLAPYGPLALGLQAAVVGRLDDAWIAALALKTLYTLPTLLFVLAAAVWTGARENDRTSAVLTVGWQPLLMLEFGGNGHSDGLMGVLAAFAVLASARRRPIPAGVLLGFSALVKMEALLFLPLLVAREAFAETGAFDTRRARILRMACPLIALAVVLGGYGAFGGPQVALPGLRAEAAKVLRSVPHIVGYLSGMPTGPVVIWMRVAFLGALAAVTVMVGRGLPIVTAAPLVGGLYLLLGKSFLQPWHGAILVYLLGAARLSRARSQLLGVIVGAWSVTAVLGGYTYLIAVGSLAQRFQAMSTIIMVGPVLLATLACVIARRGRRSATVSVA